MTEISLEKIITLLTETNELLKAQISHQDSIIELLRPKPRKSPVKSSTEPLTAQMEPHRGSFPPREYERFLSYWTEVDSKGTERWQKQTTWNVAARMRRWMMNKDDKDYQQSARLQIKNEPEPPRREFTPGNLSKVDFSKYERI